MDTQRAETWLRVWQSGDPWAVHLAKPEDTANCNVRLTEYVATQKDAEELRRTLVPVFAQLIADVRRGGPL